MTDRKCFDETDGNNKRGDLGMRTESSIENPFLGYPRNALAQGPSKRQLQRRMQIRTYILLLLKCHSTTLGFAEYIGLRPC